MMAPGLADDGLDTAKEKGSKGSLTARYTSPSRSKVFVHPISAALPTSTPSADVKQKTAYLSELRKSTKTLQEEINVFLTQKMEEDKRKAAGVDQMVGGKAMDEVEEENYGEEGAEDDEAG